VGNVIDTVMEAAKGHAAQAALAGPLSDLPIDKAVSETTNR
jgi:hypothetical protein